MQTIQVHNPLNREQIIRYSVPVRRQCVDGGGRAMTVDVPEARSITVPAGATQEIDAGLRHAIHQYRCDDDACTRRLGNTRCDTPGHKGRRIVGGGAPMLQIVGEESTPVDSVILDSADPRRQVAQGADRDDDPHVAAARARRGRR